MTEENKFKCIDTTPIYDDGIGYVKLYDASHANESEEQRIWTVATISSLAYGNEEAKHPERLYKKLQELGHESLSEFIRDGFGTFTINSSMRIQPYQYENNYSFDADLHKQNIACFRIKVPMFVRSQFMRHRSFSYLEMSRRYTKDSKVPFEFWFPKGMTEEHKRIHSTSWLAGVDSAKEEYSLHTQVASRFLPQTTYTEYYCMGEVEGLKNFFSLRLKSDAQAEIREVAMAMVQLLAKHQEELYKKVLP